MKRIIGIIICFTLLFISCNKDNKKQNTTISEQTENASLLNKTMFVNASSGLRVRNSPSTEGDRIGVLENNTKVNVVKETDDLINLDGVEGKWVYINSPLEGWIFDGFLCFEPIRGSKEYATDSIDEKKMFVGKWLKEDVIYKFNDNGIFERSVLESVLFYSGKWDIINNKLIININYTRDEEDGYNFDDKWIHDFKFIDDMLVLSNDSIYIKVDDNIDIWSVYFNYSKRFGK